MSHALLRPLGAGEILDGAFTLYRRHFLTLFATALLAFLPMVLVGAFFAPEIADPEQFGAGMALLLLTLVMVTAIGWAALTRQIAQAVVEEEVSIGDGYRHGVRALLPLLGAAILAYVVITLIALVLAFVGVFVMLTFGGEENPVLVALLAVLAGLVFLVGTIAALFAVPAAVVVEGRGPWQALKRSWQLARGAWLRVVGIALVAVLIVSLPSLGLLAVGATTGLFSAAGDATATGAWAAVETALSSLIGALTYPFLVGAITLLYFDRRVRTEALDLEVAARDLANTP